MARLTTLQQTHLNRASRANQDAVLGTRIDNIEYGGVASPAVGTVTNSPVVQYAIAPANASNTAVHANITLIQTVTQDISTNITNPDVPRVLSITGVTNVTGNVVITGTDMSGATITDTIASNGTATVVGAKAFKTVTNINVPPYAVAGTETISIGIANKFGMPVALSNTGFLLVKNFNNAADSGTLTASATLSSCFFSINGTPDGAKILDLYFIVP